MRRKASRTSRIAAKIAVARAKRCVGQTAAAIGLVGAAVRAKCSRRPAAVAAILPRCRSTRVAISPCIVAIVSKAGRAIGRMRTIKGPLQRALLALLGCVVAGCSGGNATTSSFLACAAGGTLPAPPQMVYPANGATGIPDGNFTLQLSAQYGNSLELTSASGQAITLIPQAGSSSYSIPQLSAATTYAIHGVFAPATQGCPSTVSGGIGSFTTQ